MEDKNDFYEDFAIWYANWKFILLKDLIRDAYNTYLKTTNAISSEGKIKDENLRLIVKIWETFPEYRSYGDICKHIDMICNERADEQINDAEYLLKLTICCQEFVDKIPTLKPTSKKDFSAFLSADWSLTDNVNLMIGRLSKNTNLGAEAMKKRGINNSKAVGEIVEKMRINNFGIFRTDKKQRDLFFSEARRKTTLTSEDRILRLAREYIRKKKSKS